MFIFPRMFRQSRFIGLAFEATIFMLFLSYFQVTACLANIHLSACARDSVHYNPHKKKTQREPHLYSADHAVILGLANTLRGTAEHHKMSSIKQGVCEGEVEYYF